MRPGHCVEEEESDRCLTEKAVAKRDLRRKKSQKKGEKLGLFYQKEVGSSGRLDNARGETDEIVAPERKGRDATLGRGLEQAGWKKNRRGA